MNNNTLTGKVIHIGETESFGSGDFCKRPLAIEFNDGKFTQTPSIEFIKDKGDILNDLSLGDEVTIHYDVRGRLHNGRYWTSLSGYKVQVNEKAQPASAKPEQEDDGEPPF